MKKIYLSGKQVKRLKELPKGWEWNDKKNTRPIRNHEMGMLGQEIWLTLEQYGFMHKDSYNLKTGKPLHTAFERKLKNWLVWGYWE